MNEKQITKVIDLLEKAGEQIGAHGEYLWHMLVQGRRIEGLVTLLCIVLGCLVAALCCKAIFKYGNSIKEGDDEALTVVAIGIVASLGVVLIVFRFVPNLIMQIACPEYTLFLDLMQKYAP